jgi:hypothetical protein
MTHNKFGEIIYSESDLCDLIMSGQAITTVSDLTVDHTVDLEQLLSVLEKPGSIGAWKSAQDKDLTVDEFDSIQQSHWYMPAEYQTLDIAAYIISLCSTSEELQRAGEELLLYQERGLFNLLRYLKYLVDVMRDNQIIWGVGRGSCVSSYVLYLLGVHRINSMFYDLNPREFLR